MLPLLFTMRVAVSIRSIPELTYTSELQIIRVALRSIPELTYTNILRCIRYTSSRVRILPAHVYVYELEFYALC